MISSRFKQLFHSLSFQIFFPKLLITLLIMTTLYLFVSSYIEQTFEEHILPEHIDKVVEGEKERLEMAFDQSFKLLQDFVHRKSIQEFLLKERDDPQPMSGYIQETMLNLKNNHDFRSVYIAGLKSHNYYTEEGFIKKINLLDPDNDWFLNTLDSGSPYSFNIDNALEGEPYLWIDALVRYQEKIVGLAGCRIDLSQFIKHLQHIDMGPMTHALIVDGKLTVKLSNFKNGTVNRALDSLDSLSDESKKAIKAAIFNMKKISSYRDSSGKKHYVVLDYVKALNWFYIVELPIDKYQKLYEPIQYAVIVIAFVLLMLLQLLNYAFITKRIIRPLERFGKTMENYDVAKGFDVSVFENETGEIKNMARRFSLMDNLLRTSYRKLKELNTSLEDKVASQTAELQSKVQELAQANHELHLANDKALSALKARFEFISNVSHELRTPLNSIINFSQVVLEDFDDMLTDPEIQQDSREYLQRVYHNSTHLLALINDILDFSKLEAGSIDLHTECVPLNVLLSQVHANCHPNSKKSEKIDYRFEMEKQTIYAPVDRRRFTQIIYNLLSNALKFTKKGYVELRCFQNDDGSMVEISDSGRGIPEEKITEIFEPFVQLRHNDKGTGLGLGIVKQLCDSMNIRLEVESKVDQGSIFRLYLPSCQTQCDDTSLEGKK